MTAKGVVATTGHDFEGKHAVELTMKAQKCTHLLFYFLFLKRICKKENSAFICERIETLLKNAAADSNQPSLG